MPRIGQLLQSPLPIALLPAARMLTYVAAPAPDCKMYHIDREFIYVAPLDTPTNRRVLADWRPQLLESGQAPPEAFEDKYGWALVAKGKDVISKFKVRV